LALELSGPAAEEEDNDPAIETPVDLRPDLSAIGLIEHEKGIVEDNYENRQALRAAQFNWDAVYTQTGSPTGLIAARSQEQTRERRVLSLNEKKPLLTDPRDLNSDYLTGLDLIVDDTAIRVTPPWVVGSTRKWLEEQERGGPLTAKRAPAAKPHRCKIIKSDGLRCMLWSSGRIKDDGLCRVHLRTVRKPGEDVERARRKLMQSAPYAVDVLEQLMESADSEPVRLKASTEILDRAGVRAGMDLNIDVEVTDGRSPAQILQERLGRLAEGAARTQRLLEVVDAETVEDAEVVETPAAAAPQTEEILTPQPTDEDGETAASDFDDDELKDIYWQTLTLLRSCSLWRNGTLTATLKTSAWLEPAMSTSE
jgi:hypothetical protein